jgi:hypothetical protein
VARLIAGVAPPEDTTGDVPVTDVTGAVPLEADVIWPCALTVMLAFVYDPAVTAVLDSAIVIGAEPL